MKWIGWGELADPFAQKHSDARASLAQVKTKWESFTPASLTEVKAHADQVKKSKPVLWVIDVKNNDYRLVVDVMIAEGMCVLLHAFTHAEYDRWCSRH